MYKKLSIRHLATLVALFLIQFNCYSDVTKTVGASGADYARLQLAFAAINSGTLQGQIVLQIIGSTTETASAVLNASGSGSANYTSVHIYPTAASTISTAGNWVAIDLNGADNVTIDGRIDGSGTPNSLAIIGTSTGNGAAGIRFVNSAENNTVKYCNIQACSASSSMGIIAFGGSSLGNGNDNNIVENCNLTNSGSNRPYNGIVSSGSTGRENNGVIIRNNNIYDTFQTGVSSNGISINTNSVGFTISGNSIYETTDFVTNTGSSLIYNGIYVSSTSQHTISGNYIGGKAALCGGAQWSITAGNTAYFCGIYAYAGNTATTISNNTIANINYSSKEDNPWDGIFLFTGNFDVSDNTIGATTGTGSITLSTPVPLATTTLEAGGISSTITVLNGGSGYLTAPIVTFTNPPTGGTAPTATANLTGGVVTSITVNTQGSGYTTAPAVIFDGQSNNYSTSHGMIQNSTGTVNITGNNIGSITTVGSTHYSHGFESIYVRTVPGTTSITNNLIGSPGTANSINVSSAAASSLIKQDVYGIYSAGTGITTITGNTVANLTNAFTGTNSGARSRGIQTTGGTNIIQNNTVRNISTSTPHNNAGSSASLVGISQTSTTGTTQIVNGNTVYNLSNTSGTAKVQLFGMYYAGPSSGTNSVSGNFVHSLSASSSDIGAVINGIFINSGLVTCANNIINLGGTSLGYLINGIWDGSSAGNNVSFYFNTVYIGGNVSSGITSNTAGLWNANNTSTRNYRNNIFYNARTGGTNGKHYAIRIAGTTNLTTNYNDYYISGTNGVLGYLATDKSTLVLLQAATGQDANSKDVNPGFAVPGGTSAINYYPSAATLTGVSGTGIITDYYGITRNVTTPKMGALEQNENVWQGNTSTDFNTASNWANNEVPASGADIFFATSPGNDCALDANRTVGIITNGSSKNLLVNGKTLTLNSSLNFTSSGKINTSTASSVVKFGGTSAQTIPAAAFVNSTVAGLEISNSSGVALDGNLTVSSTLTLTSGILTVGANTLTYSGSSPTSAGGTVDVSNALAELIFANATAITLPATFFTGSVNNLTISALGGVTAGSDITVNGVLNLAAANPSATKGLLEMVISYTNYPGTLITHYLNSYLLNMGASATTIGVGDVTGTVKRTTIVANTPYTFGNQFTTISLTTGTMPSALAVSITIGTSPGLTTPTDDIIRDAIKRTYEIVPTGGSDCYVTANFHYLDSELTCSNSPFHVNTEQKLTTMDYDIDINNHGYPYSDEHGRANYDYTNNYIGLSSVPISYFIQIPVTHEWRTIFTLRDYGAGYFTWDGSKNSSDWNDAENWTVGVSGSGVPTTTGHVIIPNAASTGGISPALPTGSTTINTISIENGGMLTMGSNTLILKNTFSGGWEDQNSAGNNPGTSTVIFDLPDTYGILPHTTVSGNTRFYNVELADGVDVTNQEGSTMKIENSITKIETGTGKWYADVFENTVEYNKSGDQTILMTDGTKSYWNLTLGGSGTKTSPSSAMTVRGNLNIDGSTTASSGNSVNVDGNLVIGSGATIATGTYSHEIKGYIICDGTITPGSGVIIMNGSSPQSIEGSATSSFYNLTIDNSLGVVANKNIESNSLTINSGKLFTIAPTVSVNVATNITNNAGAAGLVVKSSSTQANGSLIFHNANNNPVQATVEMYSLASKTTEYKWQYFGVPVASFLLAKPSPTTDSPVKGSFIRHHFESGTTSAKRWVPQTNDSTLTAFSGYEITQADAKTISFTGTLVNTDYSSPVGGLSYTTGVQYPGQHLIGNSFTAAIDIKKIGFTGSINADVILYNTGSGADWNSAGSGGGSGTEVDTPGQYIVIPKSAAGINGLPDQIPSMQAFLVKATGTGAGVSIPYNDVITNTTKQRAPAAIKPAIRINVSSDKSVYSDVMWLISEESCTHGFENGWDGAKYVSEITGAPQLYAKEASGNYQVNSVNDFNNTNLGFVAADDENYTLTFTNQNLEMQYPSLYLYDMETNDVVDITASGTKYNFSVPANSTATNRFKIVTSPDQTNGGAVPASDILKVYSSNNKIFVENSSRSNATFKLFDVSGRIITTKLIGAQSTTQIDLNLMSGIYVSKTTLCESGAELISKVQLK